MKAPISWLKEYVDITSNINDLMWKMTEIGLTCESYDEIEGDKILDIEVTPNRPDWLSITGIAREIAIIENSKLTLPKLSDIPKPTQNLPINISFKTNLTGGYAGITISGVKVGDSPAWMQKRLISIGLRPINNLVDITNYVMFELGCPIHVFDYDKFLSTDLSMQLSKGSEEFVSVDGLKYKLPPDTLIIKDTNRVIDLCGIKGGQNTGISESTKNIFIHTPIYNGSYIRKTSQALKLKSDASYIYERGPNPKIIPDTLKRVVTLVLELAGGEVASKPIFKIDKFIKDKIISFDLDDLNKFLGISIQKELVLKILEHLDFSPKITGATIKCIVPNFRSDVNLVEDIYEEIARIYSYNKFPRTLPSGKMASVKIPYFYDREFELVLKNIVSSAGYFEISSEALTSKEIIEKSGLNPENHIRIANPVSAEYEFMRTSLIPTLLAGIKVNTQENLKIFEYGKVYFAPVEKATEVYKISGVLRNSNFENVKGLVDLVLEKLNITNFEIKSFAISHGLWHPNRAGVIEMDGEELGIFGEISPKVLHNLTIKGEIFGFELDVTILKKFRNSYLFKPIPKFPPQIEDVTLVIKGKTEVGKVINEIKRASFVDDVTMLGTYQNTISIRINYSDVNKTLTDKEVAEIRKSILGTLSKKFGVKQK